jgi:hypothetical protein
LPISYSKARTRRTRLRLWPDLLAYCLGVFDLLALWLVFRARRVGSGLGGGRGPVSLSSAGSPAPVSDLGGVFVFFFCLLICWPVCRGPS